MLTRADTLFKQPVTVKIIGRLKEALQHPILGTMPALNELGLRYPRAISLGSGRPADQFCTPEHIASLLPVYKEYLSSTRNFTQVQIDRLLGQYGPSAGIINEVVAQHLRVDEQINVLPEHIVITVGFQEAAELCVKTLFNSSDVLIVPDPIFSGITGAAILNNVNLHPVRWDGGKFDSSFFEQVLKDIKAKGLSPRALYVIPDFSNPYGTILPLDDRQELLKWANTNNIVIIEDNPYSTFSYKQEKVPSLKALDANKNVIYIGSAAKTVHPGLRIGYVVANQMIETEEQRIVPLASILSMAKSFLTVNTPPLDQALFAALLIQSSYSLKKHNAAQVAFNQANLEHMLSALEQYLPDSEEMQITWNKPHGGYFLVLKLPYVFSKQDMEDCARDSGVIVIPLSMFSLLDQASKEIRLSFTNVSPENINEGVKRLADFLKNKYNLLHGATMSSKEAQQTTRALS